MSAVMLKFFVALALLFCCGSSLNLSNETTGNPTTTAQPTTFFTTRAYGETDEPTMPSNAPSPGPTMPPTPEPTRNPTKKLSTHTRFAVEIIVVFTGITKNEANSPEGKEVIATAVEDAVGTSDSQDNEDIDVIVLSVTTVDAGTQIDFIIVTSDGHLYNHLDEQTDETGSSAATFFSIVEMFVQEAYAGAELQSYEQTSSGSQKKDSIYKKNLASFGELFASWYLLLGLLMIFVGSVWLLFLRGPANADYEAVSGAAGSEEAIVSQSDVPSGRTNVELVETETVAAKPKTTVKRKKQPKSVKKATVLASMPMPMPMPTPNPVPVAKSTTVAVNIQIETGSTSAPVQTPPAQKVQVQVQAQPQPQPQAKAQRQPQAQQRVQPQPQPQTQIRVQAQPQTQVRVPVQQQQQPVTNVNININANTNGRNGGKNNNTASLNMAFQATATTTASTAGTITAPNSVGEVEEDPITRRETKDLLESAWNDDEIAGPGSVPDEETLL